MKIKQILGLVFFIFIIIAIIGLGVFFTIYGTETQPTYNTLYQFSGGTSSSGDNLRPVAGLLQFSDTARFYDYEITTERTVSYKSSWGCWGRWTVKKSGIIVYKSAEWEKNPPRQIFDDVTMDLGQNYLYRSRPSKCVRWENYYTLTLPEGSIRLHLDIPEKVYAGENATMTLIFSNMFKEVIADIKFYYIADLGIAEFGTTQFERSERFIVPTGITEFSVSLPVSNSNIQLGIDMDADIKIDISGFTGVNAPNSAGDIRPASVVKELSVARLNMPNSGILNYTFDIRPYLEVINSQDKTIGEKIKYIDGLDLEQEDLRNILMEYEGRLEDKAILIEYYARSEQEKQDYIDALEIDRQEYLNVTSQMQDEIVELRNRNAVLVFSIFMATIVFVALLLLITLTKKKRR